MNTPAKTPTDQNKLLLLTQIDHQSGAVNKPASQKNLNVELPLSIMNAASLGASGINLRINPFMFAKNTANPIDLGDSLPMSDDFVDLTSNEFEDAAKTNRLLENYKAIKVGQMQKEKEKQQQLSASLQKAPIGLSSSNSSIPTMSTSPKSKTTTTAESTPHKEAEASGTMTSVEMSVNNSDTVAFEAGAGSDDEVVDYDDECDGDDDDLVDDDDEMMTVEDGAADDEIYSNMYNGSTGGGSTGGDVSIYTLL